MAIYNTILYTLRDPASPSQSTDFSACRSVWIFACSQGWDNLVHGERVGPTENICFLTKKKCCGCIGLRFRCRVTIHQRHLPYAKNTRFLHETVWFWALKLTKTIIFGESEGHLELSWALNRDPWGLGGPQLVHSSSKWAPNGASKSQGGPGYGPQELKMSQKSPNITLSVAKNGQREHQKGV